MAFTIIKKQHIAEQNCTAIHLKHNETSCEVLHVQNDDPENLFSFCFRTIPESSRGVAHILEHTVLCGSKRYPVKDPFVQLAKGSMNTFLNAMTYPDRTLYPASSAVQADLINIMKVYGDAVYFPLIKKPFFQQEGHHLRLEDDALHIHGIVYNEMKGNYSSHDDIAMHKCMSTLFTKAPYTYDTGGDPREIPDLTYDEFLAFHKRFYHPSNTLVFLYGNIETERYLDVLEKEFLHAFTKQESPYYTQLAHYTEPELSKRQIIDTPYPSSTGEGQEKSSVSLCWRLFPSTDVYHRLVLSILSELLIGNAASPLYKVLIESRLGESLTQFSGVETDLSLALFAVGLEGTSKKHADAIEACIMDCLAKVHKEGFSEETVLAQLRKYELKLREQRRGSKASLALLRRVMCTWTYNEDPFNAFTINQALNMLKDTIKNNPTYLQDLVHQYFIANNNSMRLTVYPDNTLNATEDKKLQERLQKRLESMGDAEKEQIAAEANALQAMQMQADTKESLDTIPRLQRKDVPRAVEKFPWEERKIENITTIYTPQFTNDVLYLQCVFDIGDLNNDQLSILPLLGTALTECGLEDMTPEHLADEIYLKTGGINFGISTDYCSRKDAKQSHFRPMVFINTAVLKPQFNEACELLSKLLQTVNYHHSTRLNDCLLEMKNGLVSSLIPEGHLFLLTRSGTGISGHSRIEEMWHGIDQLFHLQSMNLDSCIPQLIDLRDTIFTTNRMSISLTCQENDYSYCENALKDLVRTLPAGKANTDLRHVGGIEILPVQRPNMEALIAPASIAHVITSLPASPYASKESAAETVLAHLLTTDYLWQKVRMEGGAYGGFAVCIPRNNQFSLLSYRDPHVERTLSVFASALDSYSKNPVSPHDIDLSIFSIVGNDLRSLSPAAMGDKNLYRFLHGVDDAQRQSQRDIILEVGPKDVQDAAKRLSEQDKTVLVMANDQKIEEAAKTYPDIAKTKIVLPI